VPIIEVEEINMKKILSILLIAAVFYVGYLFSKPYISSHFLQKQMQGLADKADLKTDREIIGELVAFANERDLPIHRRDFKIKRHDGRTYISVSYGQVVEVPGISRQYKFKLEVSS
jgi:hypothetical protein